MTHFNSTTHFRNLVLFAALLFALPMLATTYYVSPSGNDNNSGTSQVQAWQTIDRVNQSAGQLQPGDKVLFQREGTYRGKLSIVTSGAAGSRIEVGAYGSGAQPVIKGSTEVSGWTQHNGNIWKAPFSEKPKYVFYNGQRMTLARFPNTGWLRADSGTPTSLADSDLNQASGSWTGATAVIRTTQWSYDTAYISGSSNGSLTHSSTGNDLTMPGWGYFIQNKLSQLDAAGEWYYDPAGDMLYLWCPDNGNPSNDLVEASVTDHGVYVGWQRHHVLISDMAFKHQIEASVRMSGTTDIEVADCTISDTHHAIYSTGNTQNIHDCTIQRTYATGIWLLGSGTVSHCTISDVANVPGLGENNWGYFGIRTSADNIVISDNTIDNIGYIGIVTGQNSLIERNVVSNCTAILNDGGAIALDGADGLIIRDNIVRDHFGNFESIPPQHHNAFSLSHGIYFGNTSIVNTLVQGNTVYNCDGNGIGVDHTMISAGNQVKNNVLFNNRTQLGFTDYSNYNGPGATPPYYVPSYNTVISGNVMYCLKEDQLCMDQMNVYQGPWVDFGNFSNNYYFNPYNELSIKIYSLNSGVTRFITMENWQSEFTEDATSHRSPHHFNKYDVTNVLQSNMIPNPNFDYNVNNWGSWPSQGVISHDYSKLDNGAMKVHFSNNATHNLHYLAHDPTTAIQNGQWYRLQFSLVGLGHGELGAGFKAWSQQNSLNKVYNRQVPYSEERREVTLFFQSDLSDNGNLQFDKHYTTGDYWIDNVDLERVQVTPRDPSQDQILLVNEQATAQTFNLTGCYSDVQGALHSGSITLQPFRSVVLIHEEGDPCALSTEVQEPSMARSSGPYVSPNPARVGSSVHIEGLYVNEATFVQIFNSAGTRVHQENLSAGTSTFTLPQNLGPGMYILRATQTSARSVHRLVIQ